MSDAGKQGEDKLLRVLEEAVQEALVEVLAEMAYESNGYGGDMTEPAGKPSEDLVTEGPRDEAEEVARRCHHGYTRGSCLWDGCEYRPPEPVPARLMEPSEWREWESAVSKAALVPAAQRGWEWQRILDADSHIRALLAEGLQLRQDCEHLRTELEPLRQRYWVLKHDTAEYIQAKERREQEVIDRRLGRQKRAWWRRLLRREVCE